MRKHFTKMSQPIVALKASASTQAVVSDQRLASLRGFFDFVYLPTDSRNGVNLGYAFVNLITNQNALNFVLVSRGYSKWLLAA